MPLLGLLCTLAAHHAWWAQAGPPPLHFRGGRFGVTAKVDLDLATRIASVALHGLPLGGNLRGTATLNDAGSPVLDEGLGRALARRGVRVEAVDVDPNLRECRVVVRLPFAGRVSMTLHKREGACPLAGGAAAVVGLVPRVRSRQRT